LPLAQPLLKKDRQLRIQALQPFLEERAIRMVLRKGLELLLDLLDLLLGFLDLLGHSLCCSLTGR
jgi:hypothetical protein